MHVISHGYFTIEARGKDQTGIANFTHKWRSFSNLGIVINSSITIRAAEEIVLGRQTMKEMVPFVYVNEI